MNELKNNKVELKLNSIAFGAWAIGGSAWGGNVDSDSLKALEVSIENGLTTIDTAPIYGYGLSEELVGKTLKKMKNRADCQILSKGGINWNTTKGKFYFKGELNGKERDVYLYSGKEGIVQECEESLRRLQTDYIDLYQIHRPDPTTPIEETMLALEQLQKDGKILKAGVSNFNLEQLQEATRHIEIFSNQLPYSMLERGIEKDITPFCIENNIGILAYSPLQRGVLTGKIQG